MATREHVVLGGDEELAAIDEFLAHPRERAFCSKLSRELGRQHAWVDEPNAGGTFAPFNLGVDR